VLAADRFDNSGVVDVQGTLVVDVGIFNHLAAGVLQGSGVLDLQSALIDEFDGEIRPGTSPGILTVDGSLAPGVGSRLAIELGGTTAGTGYDRLAMTGTFAAAGSLDVTLVNGFEPSLGDIFAILYWGNQTGEFTTVNLPVLAAGLVWRELVGEGGFALEVAAAAPPPLVFAGDSAYGLSPWIFSAAADGSLLTRLASSPPFTSSTSAFPRWAPDRSRIAFGQQPAVGPYNLLSVVSADGAETATVVSDINTRLPRWSPDGRHLAFACGPVGVPYEAWDVCAILSDVSGPILPLGGVWNGAGRVAVTESTPATRPNGMPAFAWDPLNPDYLVVVRDSSTAGPVVSGLYRVRYDGTSVQPIAPIMDLGSGPLRLVSDVIDWSADGTRLVFMAQEQPSGAEDLFAINRDGTGLTRLTSGPDDDARPVFSPDGTEILFARDAAPNYCAWDAWIMNADGSGQRRVTDEQICDVVVEWLGFDWSPDGAWIVVTGTDPTSGNIVLYRIPSSTTAATYTSDRLRIGRSGEGVREIQPSWRP
jgi:Tol biopolymer transport system component